MSDNKSEDAKSDMRSFTNESVSETYEGVDHIPELATQRSGPIDQASITVLTQLLKEQLKFGQEKTDELTSLKVAHSKLESDLDKKDEIVTTQAMEIRDLKEKIERKDAKIDQLQQSTGDIDQGTVKQLSEQRRTIVELQRNLKDTDNLCDEKNREVTELKFLFETFRDNTLRLERINKQLLRKIMSKEQLVATFFGRTFKVEKYETEGYEVKSMSKWVSGPSHTFYWVDEKIDGYFGSLKSNQCFSAIGGKLTILTEDPEIPKTFQESMIHKLFSTFVGNKSFLVVADLKGGLEYFNGTRWNKIDVDYHRGAIKLVSVQNDLLVYELNGYEVHAWNMSADKKNIRAGHSLG